MADKNYTDVLLEDINGKFDAVLDGISGIRERVDNLPARDEFNDVKDDIRTIKSAVKGTNKRLEDHEKRITKLETAAQS